jgi:hypothetical protein
MVDSLLVAQASVGPDLQAEQLTKMDLLPALERLTEKMP